MHAHSVRKLQLGTGNNVLNGWLNTDVHVFDHAREIVYLDVRKPFPLPDQSFDVVYCEHMLEHMEYGQALHCLRECHRVLRSGGRIRVATPSLQRLSRLYDGELTDVQRQYIDWAIRTVVEEPDAVELPGFVLNNFFRAWGHRFIYDPDTLRYALERAGFVDVEEQPVGESGDERLAGLERHMRDAPELNEYETFVLEARRP